MQRGSRKFSFGRMILNAFPNFANDAAGDVDLSPQQADDLVQYQLGQPSPRYLSELSFFVVRITENKTFSQKVYKSLLKAGIIAADPTAPGLAKTNTNSSTTSTSAGASMSTGTSAQQQQPLPLPLPPPVTTSAIGKNFVNQQSHISVHAQRKLVGMLFFWEEECTRWALLDQEEAEILRVIDEGGEGQADNKELDLALQAVEMKRKLLPSQRAEHTANVGEGVGFNLPAYN